MIVALTGGVGCGKSTVLKYFSELGWSVLDADQICHDIYSSQCAEVKSHFEARWGVGSVDDGSGNIDRKRVADIVFSNSEELDWLNSFFHPLIWNYASLASQSHEYVMFDVPLLLEAGWDSGFDAIVGVWSTIKKQDKRLEKRGWSSNEIQRRIKSQYTSNHKLEHADYGLINNDDSNDLKEQCIYLNNQLRII